MRRHLTFPLLFIGAAGVLFASAPGCGSTDPAGPGVFPDGAVLDEAGNPIGDGGPPPSFGDGGPTAETAPPCVRLQCQQHKCAGGGTTSISGKVYDPAGKNPLYNVVVYVPNATVKPLPDGASCDSCNALYSGEPIAVAQTDAQGNFTIKNAPDGANIPLVIQVGKWRKQLTIPNVALCTDNVQPDKSLTLPKNHTAPGNSIPNIAVSTGGADTLECLLSRIGLDASEYGGGAGSAGRVHIFKGKGGTNTSPAGPASPGALWSSQAELMKYDIVMLSCEGSETTGMNQQALHDYASAGGRVFASHFHYAWFNSGPYGAENLATWTPSSNDMGNIGATIVTKLPNGQTFPKGQALSDWLTNVGALPGGTLSIQEARHNADVAAANTPSQPWIIADQNASPAGATQYFSFNTPTNAAIGDAGTPNFCGRVVFSDLHVGAASADSRGLPVPSSCTDADLSDQEKALEFMLFDLSSCVTPDNQPPQPPPIIIH